jgi:hypothetical protein
MMPESWISPLIDNGSLGTSSISTESTKVSMDMNKQPTVSMETGDYTSADKNEGIRKLLVVQGSHSRRSDRFINRYTLYTVKTVNAKAH